MLPQDQQVHQSTGKAKNPVMQVIVALVIGAQTALIVGGGLKLQGNEKDLEQTKADIAELDTEFNLAYSTMDLTERMVQDTKPKDPRHDEYLKGANAAIHQAVLERYADIIERLDRIDAETLGMQARVVAAPEPELKELELDSETPQPFEPPPAPKSEVLDTQWLNSPVTQVWTKDPDKGYWNLPQDIKAALRSIPNKRIGLRSDGVVVWEEVKLK